MKVHVLWKAVPYVLSAFLISQISSAADLSENFKALESKEKEFQKRQKDQALDLMALDEIFLDSDVRALAKAAGRGNVKSVEKIIAQKVDVNSKGWKGATPLYWALRERNHTGFSRLLELGANPDIAYDGGGSIMQTALSEDDVFYLREALKHGANPNSKNTDGFTMLFKAVVGLEDPGNNEKVDLLIKAGADINARNKVNSTPIHYAAASGRFDRVFVLLEHGADPAVKNVRGEDLKSELVRYKKLILPGNPMHPWMVKVEQLIK